MLYLLLLYSFFGFPSIGNARTTSTPEGTVAQAVSSAVQEYERQAGVLPRSWEDLEGVYDFDEYNLLLSKHYGRLLVVQEIYAILTNPVGYGVPPQPIIAVTRPPPGKGGYTVKPYVIVNAGTVIRVPISNDEWSDLASRIAWPPVESEIGAGARERIREEFAAYLEEQERRRKPVMLLAGIAILFGVFFILLEINRRRINRATPATSKP